MNNKAPHKYSISEKINVNVEHLSTKDTCFAASAPDSSVAPATVRIPFKGNTFLGKNWHWRFF
jgi:hypothetical protein